MSNIKHPLSDYEVEIYNEGHRDGVVAGSKRERDRIIALLQEAISECGEQCDYCVAQEDAIEMLSESE